MFLDVLLITLRSLLPILAFPPVTPPQTIVVEATYPGANANVVGDTVAAVIEQEVNGVENLVHLASRSSSDGRYVLVATFKPGVDINMSQLLVQNRVALAGPKLPQEVMRQGVRVAKKAPVQMVVGLTSPSGSRDTLYLSNYATIQVKDELTRQVGVGAVATYGLRDYSMRAWLDPDKLQARGLTLADVIQALREQNVQVGAGQIGKPPLPADKDFQFPLKSKGRLTDPQQFRDVILKTDGKGNRIMLKDVGHVELAANDIGSSARFNGKPAVLLGVHPLDASAGKDASLRVSAMLLELRKRLPEGVQLDLVSDLRVQSEEHLLLDVDLPIATSPERVDDALEACEKLVRSVPGVQDVLTVTDNPFDSLHNTPCVLVRLAPAAKRKASRDEIVRMIRASIEKLPDAQVRLRDLSKGMCYPLQFAVTGPDASLARELAKRLSAQLTKAKTLTDVRVSQEGAPRPQLELRIDRTKAQMLGVEMSDIYSTLEAFLGSAPVSDFDRFGRTWRVDVTIAGKKSDLAKDLLKLRMRSKDGRLIPLNALAELRDIEAPGVIHRVNLQTVVPMSANPAVGVHLAEARAVCEAHLKEMRLPAPYGLVWLQPFVSR